MEVSPTNIVSPVCDLSRDWGLTWRPKHTSVYVRMCQTTGIIVVQDDGLHCVHCLHASALGRIALTFTGPIAEGGCEHGDESSGYINVRNSWTANQPSDFAEIPCTVEEKEESFPVVASNKCWNFLLLFFSLFLFYLFSWYSIILDNSSSPHGFRSALWPVIIFPTCTYHRNTLFSVLCRIFFVDWFLGYLTMICQLQRHAEMWKSSWVG
jgi:hypothetical protein